MSGFKRATVTISEEEYRRLHEADMKRRFGGHTKQKVKSGGHAADLTGALQQIESRQRQLEESLSSMDERFDRVEAETLQDILRQNTLCYESLSTIIAENAASTDDSLAMIVQRFSEQMQREREASREQIHSLTQQLQIHNQKEQIKEAAARQWLRQSVILADFIQVQFEHERFLPGRLSSIYRSLQLAQNNLAQGFPESTLPIAQQAFLALSDLHLELQQRVVAWQAAYERTYNVIRQVVSEVELNAKVHALGLDGERLPEQLEVEYWTNGKYHQLLEKSRHFLVMLEEDRTHISAEELDQISTELPNRVMDSLESLIYEARLNALNSQLRMNIAERALQALEVHGFRLDSSGYADRDMRASFSACLENADGSRVSIEVIPAAETAQELSNELVVITKHPYLKSEHEARLQWEELRRSLSQYNLEVGRPEIREVPPTNLAVPAQQPHLLNQPLNRLER